MSRNRLSLSPSVLHRRLMNGAEPRLAYRGGDVKVWQRRLRRQVRDLVGRMPTVKQRVPLRVRSMWQKEHRLGTIEKIAFTAEPGADVPAYVCLPKSAEPPYDFFICLQGHSTGMHNSIAGVRKAYRQLQRIYRGAGAADRCHLVVGKGGHRFYARDAWPVMLRELARIKAGASRCGESGRGG